MFARVLHVMLFSTCVTQVTTVVLMCLIIETMWRSERRSGRYRHNNITPPEIAVPLGISARSATLTEEPSENAPLQSRFGSLESVFDQFKGNSVSAIGDTLTEGDFFCDVASVLKKLRLSYMPRFVGGIYYIEKNDISSKVFDYARSLLLRYDDLSLIRLKS